MTLKISGQRGTRSYFIFCPNISSSSSSSSLVSLSSLFKSVQHVCRTSPGHNRRCCTFGWNLIAKLATPLTPFYLLSSAKCVSPWADGQDGNPQAFAGFDAAEIGGDVFGLQCFLLLVCSTSELPQVRGYTGSVGTPSGDSWAECSKPSSRRSWQLGIRSVGAVCVQRLANGPSPLAVLCYKDHQVPARVGSELQARHKLPGVHRRLAPHRVTAGHRRLERGVQTPRHELGSGHRTGQGLDDASRPFCFSWFGRLPALPHVLRAAVQAPEACAAVQRHAQALGNASTACASARSGFLGGLGNTFDAGVAGEALLPNIQDRPSDTGKSLWRLPFPLCRAGRCLSRSKRLVDTISTSC